MGISVRSNTNIIYNKNNQNNGNYYNKERMDAMKLFNFKKKNEKKEIVTQQTFETLTQEGELPWGWISRNKDFVDKIQNEYSYFMQNWIDSMGKEPLRQYEALKSFVLYLEEAEKLCKSKGECFEFWFYEILASPDYIEKRKAELKELTERMGWTSWLEKKLMQ